MDDFLARLQQALRSDTGVWQPEYSPAAIVLALLLAFLLGQLVAWVYVWTHTGLSYSRTFTQSLVLMAMVVCLVMFVIGNSIVTAFGLIGALAIIRFRNVLKDTRDTVFLFLALVLGMAVGSQRYVAALLGGAALLVVAAYLHWTGFGTRGAYDGHLTCRVEAAPGEGGARLQAVLRRFCRRVRRVSVQEGGGGAADYVFLVRLRDRERGIELVEELRRLPGVGAAALVLRDEMAEL